MHFMFRSGCEADTMLIESKPVSKKEQTTSEMVLKYKRNIKSHHHTTIFYEEREKKET